MSAHEWRLFPAGTVPECTTAAWYRDREHAPHLEQDAHRARLMASAGFVALTAATRGYRTVVDLGAGDGGLLSLLGPAMTGWGYDLMPANLAAAKGRGVDVRYGDVLTDPIEWADIAVCTEMLEHLVDPHAFVRTVGEHARALVCSSPWQERPGTAYEHHTWAWDHEGYRMLVEQGGWVVQRQRSVGPFQVLLAVRQ
ncbi:methionine biosynthesis protein MetW [Micromonospora sp. WMMA1363]|uniref:methyltransferase domain-containing protein n=1 Tax=Micromonospora sp. WMMA1363 TaxID=3053985 RepID=UPI00259CEE59|nr:methyltransferase domain-containing protein [Micromonospora sp. WMMA1363]MDM4722760.1 methionine biosynthesis protein MetW [Micromonospora sp. WMMA1363]